MGQQYITRKMFMATIMVFSIVMTSMIGAGYYWLSSIGQQGPLPETEGHRTLQLKTSLAGLKEEVQTRDAEILAILRQLETESEQKIKYLEDELTSIDLKSGDLVPLVDRTMPAVVSVLTPNGRGSGVVIDDEGRIITNFHAIQGSNSAMAVTSDGKSHALKMLGYDKKKDLALLKVDKKLPHLELDGQVRTGESVIAAGNPLGFDFSVAEGIVSGVRTLEDGRFIQHTVAINPGNSGGPLINTEGEVVGINTFKLKGQEGLGFAIPADVVREFYERVVG